MNENIWFYSENGDENKVKELIEKDKININIKNEVK